MTLTFLYSEIDKYVLCIIIYLYEHHKVTIVQIVICM